MHPPQDEIARTIEDGTYFTEARHWYSLLYITPISERILFLIITVIAVVIFAFAVTSVYNLLPIKPRVPFMYRASDIMNEVPTMIRFKAPNEPSNPALIKYYLGTYVTMRESYQESQFLLRWKFMQNYSNPSTFAEYSRMNNPENPRSLIRQYGKYADVKTTLQDVTFNREVQPFQGVVNFSTEVIGTDNKKKTNWTATIRFEYTDLTETDHFDESIGDYVLNFTEPTFKVVSYDVRERLVLEQ